MKIMFSKINNLLKKLDLCNKYKNKFKLTI